MWRSFTAAATKKIGVLWIDAHTDINTPETSPSGNVHGMPLAALLGLGPEPLANLFGYAPKIAAENVALIGVRDIDAAERENMRRAGVTHVYTMRDIDERGMRTVMEEALRAAAAERLAIMSRSTWTGSIRRMRPAWARRCAAARRIARRIWPWRFWPTTAGMLSFEIVEVNPVIDEHNRTADLAVELACSAFGKKIL